VGKESGGALPGGNCLIEVSPWWSSRHRLGGLKKESEQSPSSRKLEGKSINFRM